MESEKRVRPIQYLADVELPFEEELNNIAAELSQEEETILHDIIETEKQIIKPDFMSDLLSAVKKGAEAYLDAITDTGETFDQLKNSKEVNQWQDESLVRKQASTTLEENERVKPRSMSEASQCPFDNDSAHSTNGMSNEGAAKFSFHLEAYKERTKSITNLSTESNTINYKQDIDANLESLSGIRGYRVGIVVPMDSISEVQRAFQEEVKSNGLIDNKATWIRERNFDKFDEALVKEYGFKSKAEARAWRKSNHLTIHESADGMILVPTDVHDRASHSGYCSQMVKLLKGDITREQFDKSVTDEKIAYVKHEAKQHGIRAAKGFGMAVVKDMLRFSIVTVCEETYNEFKQFSEDQFVQRMMRILNNCWQKFKSKFMHVLKSLLSGGLKSVLNELLTMLNDYFLGVFKKIFKVVRQMLGSIKSAFKIIRSKNYSWKEKMFEAAKILSAGIVGILGFSLNELLEKILLSVAFPFASFVSECLSGLFAGIMSAVVLMLFDNLKAAYKSQSAELVVMQQQSRLYSIYTQQISLESLKTDVLMLKSYMFFDMTFSQILNTREKIIANFREGRLWLDELTGYISEENERRNRLSNMVNEINDYDF